MNIKELAIETEDYIIKHRRHIHENPELSGREENTVAYIINELESLGIKAINVPQGGVIGVIEGKGPGKTVLLRADVDALPINESPVNLKGPKNCISKCPGVSHMCGHDSHTAMLLGIAKILSKNTDQFNGRVIAAFERGEEAGHGEVINLINYMKQNDLKYDFCWGMHVIDTVPAGQVQIASGPVNAGYYLFEYAIRGKGGHGSRPDLFNNPIDCFVAIYNSYNTLRWRHVDPFDPLTSSMGILTASSNKTNIIPDEVRFGGSLRFYSEEKGAIPFIEAFNSIIENTAKMYNCEVRPIELIGPNPSVINDKAAAQSAKKVLAGILGEDAVHEATPSMGSESYAYFMKEAPGLFITVGIHTPEKGTGGGMHNALFDMDESGLKYGVMAALAVALDVLSK